MTLTQLEYFCAVCRYHSITRAAEALFVTADDLHIDPGSGKRIQSSTFYTWKKPDHAHK